MSVPWLRQSTAVTVKIGPFVDSSDGDTEEDGLTISQADVRLSKNGGNYAQKNDSTDCTHDELGEYDCPLNATDTGTLGRLRVAVHEAGALHVWKDFMVVPANVWDSLFGSDKLDVSVVQWLGTTPAALTDTDKVQASVQHDGLSLATAAGQGTTQGLISALPSASAIASAVWASGTRTLSSFGTLVADTVAAVWGALLPGAFGAGSAGQLVGDSLDAAISSRSSHSAPDLSNLDATVSSRSSHSAADVETAVWASGTRTLSSFGTLVSDVATAVWAAAARTLTAVTGLGLATEAKQDTIISTGGTGPWTTGGGGGDATAANQATMIAALTTIAGYVDTEVAAIKAKTDNLPGSPAAAGDAMTLTAGAQSALVTALLGGTIDGAVDLQKALQAILALCGGKATPAGDDSSCQFFAQDGSTVVVTVSYDTGDPGKRTGSTVA